MNTTTLFYISLGVVCLSLGTFMCYVYSILFLRSRHAQVFKGSSSSSLHFNATEIANRIFFRSIWRPVGNFCYFNHAVAQITSKASEFPSTTRGSTTIEFTIQLTSGMIVSNWSSKNETMSLESCSGESISSRKPLVAFNIAQYFDFTGQRRISMTLAFSMKL